MPFCAALSNIFPSGTLLAPGAFFAADPDTGFYLAGANQIGVAGSMVFAGITDALNAVYLNPVDPNASLFSLFSSAGANPFGVRRNVWMGLGYNLNAGGVIDAAEYQWYSMFETHWNPSGTPYLEYHIDAVEPTGSTVTRPFFITVEKTAALSTIQTWCADTFYFSKTKSAFTVMTLTMGATAAASTIFCQCPTVIRDNATPFQVQNVAAVTVVQVDAAANAHTLRVTGDCRNNVGWTISAALVSEMCSWALTSDNLTNVQSAVSARCQLNAAVTRTCTAMWSFAVNVLAPIQGGAGTCAYHALGGPVGVKVENQGTALATNSFGLLMDNQAGSGTASYAIKTGTGINYLGDQTRIYQPAAGGAVPPLLLSQADDDQDMIEFTGVVGVGNCIEAKGAKTLTVTHFIKCTITGVGEGYVAFGTIA